VKIIAHYLPQFHDIPENNIWWGPGYTEWTAVKRAKPLFKDHYQPRIPLNEEYYRLDKVETLNWQTELAKKHGIYGFCIWHYWFMGKLLLEKPADIFISKEKTNFPFCFAWGNESWTRAWYGQENKVLIEQKYGNQKSWEQHYYYLNKFFSNENYIKINNKPILAILNTLDIPECERLLERWNDLALKEGFSGIYYVQILSGRRIDNRSLCIDAQLRFEPGYTLTHVMPLLWREMRRAKALIKRIINRSNGKHKFVENILSYDELYRHMLLNNNISDKKQILGSFTDWDNSPRREYSSTVYRGSTPAKYEKYLITQIEQSQYINKSDMLFINAWNEWAEGAYLEPDLKNGYGYLEAVKNALNISFAGDKGNRLGVQG